MSTVRYKTLNSTYEHDVEGARARRVGGDNDPTPNTGTDGAWKDAHNVIRTAAGALLIHWMDGSWTRTSPVVLEEVVA